MNKTFTELIKEAFRNKKKLTLQELYQYVIEHKEELEKSILLR
jgi:hemerythrin superfamily protein